MPRPQLFVPGALALAAWMAACGGSSTTVAEASADGGASDAQEDQASSDGDVGTRDASADVEVDAPAPLVGGTLEVDTLFQDCMPAVAPDPLTMQGLLRLENEGASPIGPLTFASGRFLRGGAQVATFEVDTVTQIISPGGKAEVLVEKQPGTLSPKGGCAVLTCNEDVVVELAFTGPGVSGAGTVRGEAKVSCAF